ncbi:antitoxin [Azorhizobium oxalatiphilum]|uniref:Antitoxin n=1 Tax=Azorhizobium oxalatiphilum TaxID=980631 RepID=A0A917CFH2_9HYPH|nr:type II toxin-antitoxin system prevent-host-death family antitoxin [Azorhizobium oxalatiphilum]GGF87234.1 antitoxin [Azorhizobium oxalatiphilum]
MTTRAPDLIRISAAGANLCEVMDQVQGTGAPVVLTRGAAEAVVVAPLSNRNGMEETLHLLSSPAGAARLNEAIGELNAGRGPVSRRP